MTSTISRAFTHLLVIWCCIWVREATSTCYFADYLQGEYLMQSGLAVQSQVQYTSVSITLDGVSTLGYCQKKIANDLYLIEHLSNSSYCIRCFHISVKSPNILVMRTSGNPDRCYISAPAAENSCPRADYLEHTRQVILYKTSKDIKKVHCPINGRYMIKYQQNKADNPVECASRTSEMSNCPVGSELKIRFQDCPFENHDITFECLGSWNGPNNQQYLALFDTRSGGEQRPQYRCGLYLEDSANGVVYIAFSSDSTCLTDLKSSQSGFEMLVLTPYPNAQPHIAKCRFPDWIEGEWDSATISEYVFSYTDRDLFKTYSFQCMNYDESDKRYEFPISGNDEKKMIVYGKTRCGEELYTCIWAKRRGINVFEFQLGNNFSPNYNSSLCLSVNFQPSGWITQARQNYLANSPCPIEGEYVGSLPNVEGVCAKLASECSSLDTMYYSVTDCSEQIYEDREYRCLGQWQENGLTYTFTERKYVGTYECFVGSPISDTQFSIREAGRHCARDNDTLLSMLGMVLTKKSSCPTNRNVSSTIFSVPWLPPSSSPPPPPPTTTTPQTIPPGTVTTTKYTPRRVTQPLLPSHTTVRAWRSITNITSRPQSPFRSKGGSQSGGNQSGDGIKNVPLPFSGILVLISIYYIQYCLFLKIH